MRMIKKTLIVNTPTNEKQLQYLNVEFTDGTFVNLDEEELKNIEELGDKASKWDNYIKSIIEHTGGLR
jgi:hypothetical protein